MIRSILTGAVLGLATQPALALSCLAPDVARSTQQAMDASESYRIVVGTFDFDAMTPSFDGTSLADNQAVSITSKFSGNALTPNGFDAQTEGEVILNVSCTMGICGNVPARTEVLAFLRQEAGKSILDVGACPQWTFPEPTDAQEDTVLSCVTGDCPAN